MKLVEPPLADHRTGCVSDEKSSGH